MAALAGKNVVLGVTGGISAYKAAELCRLLKKAGARVRVVMTEAACEFITPLTLQTLSGERVARRLFDLTEESEIGHIRVADEADLLIVAPATADALARMAAGMADDLLTAVVLATRAPLLLAPAMNVNMWEHPLTRDNLKRLLGTGRVRTVGPDAGELACGWVGAGRLVDPAEIARAAEDWLAEGTEPARRRDLEGRRVVVTAGPTFEAVDAVRFIGNRSSGKMGFAIAAEAARRGAHVTLIAGPVALQTPVQVAQRVDVESALEMQVALDAAMADADALVMTAAVSDFRPAQRRSGKLSRRDAADGLESLALVANPDLLATLGARRRGSRPLLVGFAAETVSGAALVARARGKLAEKRCDVVVANDVSTAGLGFGSDRNAITLVFADGRTVEVPPDTKSDLARVLWTELVPLLSPVSTPVTAVVPSA